MIEILVDIFLICLGLYLVIGLIFSLYFVFRGIVKLDEGVKDSPWHFRLLIWPGSVLLWSVLLLKIIRK